MDDDVAVTGPGSPAVADSPSPLGSGRPVPPRRGPVLDVLDHGARGDGITDDADAFRSAFRAAAEAGGGTVRLPPLTYLLNEVVLLVDDLDLEGAGATLIKTAGPPVFFAASSGPERGYGSGVRRVRVDGLTFRGDFGSGRTACAFALHHAQDVVVQHCRFVEVQGPRGHCLDLCGCRRIRVRSCTFEGFLTPDDPDYAKTECIQLDQSRWGALSYDDDPAGYDALFTRDVQVEDCSFLPREVDGIRYPCPNPIGAHSTREAHRYRSIRFTGNRIVDPWPDPATPESAARDDHLSWKGVTHFPTVADLIITDNTFEARRPGVGPAISVFTTDVSDLNAVPPSARPVPGPVDPIPSERIMISRNTFTGFEPCPDVPSPCMILLSGVAGGPVRDTMIIDNLFDSASAPGRVLPIRAGHTEDLMIKNNLIDGVPADSIMTGTPSRSAGHSAHPEHAGFALPDRAFSPAPLWWWSGSEVTLPRLCRQLDRLADGGVHNLVVINLAPSGPAHGALADEPAFLSEAWWELWTGLVEHARRRGTRLWFYDQLGFSGAQLQGDLVVARPEWAGAELQRVTAEVGPGERCELSCNRLGRPLSGWACAVDADGHAAGAPILIELDDDQLTWTAPAEGRGRFRVSLAYSRRTGFDFLSPEPCRALFDLVHGEFARRLGHVLGGTIAGSFQDELPSLPTWSPDFPAEFESRCGYPVERVLAALFDDLDDLDDRASFGEGASNPARVRQDYQRVRAELAEDAFFRPLHDWHRHHGLLLGCDQQGGSRAAEPLDTVRQYADYPRTHRWFSAPGSDHHGDAKIHSSLAHLHGGRRVWIEAFHSSGWGTTLEETFDWLVPWLLAGATLFDPHAVYYSTRGGWFEWAPPSSCWRQPYWAHYRPFADTVARLSRLLGRGRHVCSVGLLHPTTTVQANTLTDRVLDPARVAHETYLALAGRMSWFRPEAGVLAAARVDFDVLDDEAVAGGRAAAGRLAIADEAYDLVVVPACTMLLERTASRLVALAESGGTVLLVGPPPADSDTDAGRGACVRLGELTATGRVVRVDDPAEVAPLLPVLTESGADSAAGLADGGLTLRRRIGDLELLVVPAAVGGTATRQPPVPAGRTWRDHLAEDGYDFDPGRWRARAAVTLPPDASAVEHWDPYSGDALPLRPRPADGGRIVEVEFDRSPLAVVVWRSGRSEGESAGAPSAESAEQEHRLGPAWSAELVPTAGSAGTVVGQWRLDQVGPAETGRRVLVGHGRWAWRYGPGPADELPAPLPPGYRGPLAGEGWQPVEYSLSHGIEKDPVHLRTLGPSGRVPEEFFRVAGVGAGQAALLRTTLAAGDHSGPVTLAVGANAALDVWWNGRRLPPGPDGDGYLRLFPVPAEPGPNLLEVRCRDVFGDTLAGYWALVTDPGAFRRPEWLAPSDGAAGATLRHEFTLAAEPRTATLQLASVGETELRVNGTTVASHGGFEPYGGRSRVQPYQIGGLLRPGGNRIEAVFAPASTPVAFLLDGEAVLGDGSRVPVRTGPGWREQRPGEPDRPAAPERRGLVDPRFVQLITRPHPLPASRWLNGPDADPGVVLPPAQDADPDRPRDPLRFRTVVPPGATAVRVRPVAGELTAALDGVAVPVDAGRIRLPGPERTGRDLELSLTPAGGAVGGAVWQGPLEFECDGPGTILTGDWSDQGLAGYAGGVRYRQTVELGPHGTARLDLGRVRGTAAIMINGRPAGTRIWSPYRVDVTGLTRPGQNTVEVVVFNTLAGHLDDTSPTPMVYPGQRRAGLFGPVRLMITPTGRAEEEPS